MNFLPYGDREVEFTEKHRCLIEKIIRNNSRCSGNEDLVDDFCSETFKRAYSIINSIEDVNNLETYLNKVASSAILDVLKSSGRLVKSKGRYQQIKEKITSRLPNYDLDENGNISFDIPDPALHFEEKMIQEEEIKEIRDIILQIDAKEKSKKYLDIFICRYLRNMNQHQIASELGISQGEVSKRITELAGKISNYLK